MIVKVVQDIPDRVRGPASGNPPIGSQAAISAEPDGNSEQQLPLAETTVHVRASRDRDDDGLRHALVRIAHQRGERDPNGRNDQRLHE